MSDNKIIKALEYCADPNRTCERCALYDPNDDDCECSSKLKRAAVAYIRFKDAVIECQEHTIQKLMNDEKAREVEVRHGYWTEEGCGILVCGNCGFEYDHAGVPEEGVNYCPNCGAKMD